LELVDGSDEQDAKNKTKKIHLDYGKVVIISQCVEIKSEVAFLLLWLYVFTRYFINFSTNPLFHPLTYFFIIISLENTDA